MDSHLNISSSSIQEENQISLRNTMGTIIPTIPFQNYNQPSIKRKVSNTSIEESLINILLSPIFFNIPHTEEPEDPDKAFLISFLSDIKQLNDDDKMDLKFQFIQSLVNILNKHKVQLQNE